MKRFLLLLGLSGAAGAATLAASCALFAPGGPDLNAVALELSTYRMDVQDLLPLADEATRAKAMKVLDSVVKVETALQLAADGGPLKAVISAAQAALTIAEQFVPTGDLKFAIAGLKVVLRHIAANRLDEAAQPVTARAAMAEMP